MLDRIGTPRVIPWFQLPMVVGFVLFSQTATLPGAALAMAFLAITTGANTPLPSAFWAAFYGTANLGAIKAMAAAVSVLRSALGPGITGYWIDQGVGLETQYLGVAVYFLFATAMMVIGVGRARRLLPG